MRSDALKTRWSREKEDVGTCLIATIDKLSADQSGRIDLAKRRLGTYRGTDKQELGATIYDSDLGSDQSSLLFAQSVTDTGKAKIASKQRPKCVVLTKGGNYKHRLQAKKLSKFHEGLLHQPQGCFASTWDLGEQAFKDCEIWEAGVIKVWPDYATGKIVHERCFAHELFVDPVESESGSPRHLHTRYKADKWTLAERFSKHESAILGAKLHSDNRRLGTSSDREHDMCSVYEAWYLPYGKTKGRHVVAVDGPGKNTLVDEEWAWPVFPFAILVWERNQFGIFGTPLVDQCAAPQMIANNTFDRMAKNVRLQAGGFIDVEQNSYEDTDLQGNTAFKIMRRRQGAAPASVTVPSPFNPSVMQFFDVARGMCFEIPGVSEMSSQGRKEPGVESGVAIRSVNDLQSERFLPKSRAYEQLYVDIGRLDMFAARDMHKAGVRLKVSYAQGGTMHELDWSTIQPEDDDMFEVTLQAANASEDTLAGRRQLLSEYAAAGYITQQEAARMLATPNPDTESFGKRFMAQQNYLDRLISRFQEADEEEWDQEVDYEAPDPLLDLVSAAIAMNDGYVEMLADDAPEFNRQLARDWIVQARELLARASGEQQAPPGTVPGGGGGGMPMAEGAAPPQLSVAA